MGQTDNENIEDRQNIDIQVGEPFISRIDYTLSEQELEAYFDKQMELVKNGQEELATFELMMLGYAIDFIYFAKNAASAEIEFGEENLNKFDMILGAIHKLVAAGKLEQENFNDLAKKAAAFFGVMILKNIGGNWAQSNAGMVINLCGTNAFVYNRVARRMYNGEEDEVVSFYQAIKAVKENSGLS